MANKDNRRGFRPVTLIGGMTGVMPTWEGKMKSNQVAAYGDALYASAGYIQATATSDKAVLGVMAQKGYEKDGTVGSTTTPADILFYPAHDSVIFMGQTSGVGSQTDVWTFADIEGANGNSTGISSQEIDEDGTTNKNVWIVGLHKGGANSAGTWRELEFVWAKTKFIPRGAMVLSTQYIGY